MTTVFDGGEWRNTDECGQMSPTPGLGLVYPHPHLSPQKFVPGPHLFAKKFQSQIQNQLLILLSLFLVSLMLSFSVIKRRPLLEMQSSIHFYALYIIIGAGGGNPLRSLLKVTLITGTLESVIQMLISYAGVIRVCMF